MRRYQSLIKIGIFFAAIFLMKTVCFGAGFEPTYYDKGVDLGKVGKFVEAKKEFENSLQKDQEKESAKVGIQMIEDVSGKKINKDVAMRIFKGIDFIKTGKLDNALAELNKAVSLNAKYAYSYNYRGFAYYRKSDYKKAILDFTEAAKIDPNYIDAYYNRGLTYHMNHEYGKALEDMHKVEALGRKLDPYFLKAFEHAAEREKHGK